MSRKAKVKFSYKEILFIVILSAFVIYMTIVFEPIKRVAHNYYQVYLGGEKIGLISSKDELLKLIDEEQQEIKDKFNVDKVYGTSVLDKLK